MKITISFEKEEKEILSEMISTMGEVKDSIDKDEHYAGKFGEFKYDCKANNFVLDLKSDFVKASTKLFINYFNIIKAFAENYVTFLVSWFDDTKDLTEDEEDNNVLSE